MPTTTLPNNDSPILQELSRDFTQLLKHVYHIARETDAMVHAATIATWVMGLRYAFELNYDTNRYCCLPSSNTSCNNETLARDLFKQPFFDNIADNSVVAARTTVEYPGFCTESSSELMISTWFGYHFVSTMAYLLISAIVTRCSSRQESNNENDTNTYDFVSNLRKILKGIADTFKTPTQQTSYQTNEFKNIVRVAIFMWVFYEMTQAYQPNETESDSLIPFKSGIEALTGELRHMTHNSPAWWDTFVSFSIPIWLKGAEVILLTSFARPATEGVKLPDIMTYSLWPVASSNVLLTYLKFLSSESKTNPAWDMLRGFAYLQVGSLMLSTAAYLLMTINGLSCQSKSLSDLFSGITTNFSIFRTPSKEENATILTRISFALKEIASQAKFVTMTGLNCSLFTAAHLPYATNFGYMFIPTIKHKIAVFLEQYSKYPFSLPPRFMQGLPLLGFDLTTMSLSDLKQHGFIQPCLNQKQKKLISLEQNGDNALVRKIIELNPAIECFLKNSEQPGNRLQEKEKNGLNRGLLDYFEEMGSDKDIEQVSVDDNDNIKTIFGEVNFNLLFSHYTKLIEDYKGKKNDALHSNNSSQQRDSICTKMMNFFKATTAEQRVDKGVERGVNPYERIENINIDDHSPNV